MELFLEWQLFFINYLKQPKLENVLTSYLPSATENCTQGTLRSISKQFKLIKDPHALQIGYVSCLSTQMVTHDTALF